MCKKPLLQQTCPCCHVIPNVAPRLTPVCNWCPTVIAEENYHVARVMACFCFFLPGEVCHFHHDHAHLFGQHDDVVAIVVPLGYFGVELALLLSEALHLLGNLGLFLLGKLGHDGLWATGKETEALEQEEKLVRESSVS